MSNPIKLNNLSNYYHIFIDNLNWNDKFKLHKIITKNFNEIFKECVNVEEQLYLRIFKNISYMKYNIN